MHVIRLLALAGVLAAAALSPASAAEVQVSIANGRVTLVAKDATVRQILTEWARVGQVKIVNVERIPGGPLTLELKDMPEHQALDLLLRSVAGYLAAPRAEIVANQSRFDRVVVMATAAVPRTPVAAAPASAQPIFNPAPPPIPDDIADEQPPNVVPPGNPRGPLFNPFPQPQVVNPPGVAPATPDADTDSQETTPSATPGSMPGTVSTPGMIVPQPQAQPGQPGARH
jgi:hypothetical protein